MFLSRHVGANIILLCCGRDTVAQSATVATESNRYVGGACPATTTATTGVTRFLSIPYGKPPVGDLRFAPPQPYSSNGTGAIDATDAAPSCIQFGLAFNPPSRQSEDCLYLSVWTPASATRDSKLPVKVWIYGGGNEVGGISDPLYDACTTATDSVVVSLNYRLGPLGFLAVQYLGLQGNFAIMDQRLGLEWVQNNIAAFGGDPARVLLFGQSAGAINTWVIASMTDAPRLMRAAAMQSGGGLDLPSINSAQAEQLDFVRAMNCTVPDLKCLRAASTAQLQAAVNAMPMPAVPNALTPFSGQMGTRRWGPVVDSSLIPKHPGDSGLQVPSMFGSNAQDGSLFVYGLYGPSSFSLDPSVYDAFLDFNFGPAASLIGAQYPPSAYNGSVSAAMVALVTDATFKCPAYRGLLATARTAVPVWSYEFEHEPSCQWYKDVPAASLPFIGAAHTAEIPFVFNASHPTANCTFTAAEQSLAAALSRAWTDMAATGAPAHQDVWPAWTEALSLGVNINESMTAGLVNYSNCAFFEDRAFIFGPI